VNSTAIGYLSEAQAYRSIAIGDTAHGLGEASTAIGSSAFGGGLNSIAIGTLTQAVGANSIAQGTLAAALGTSSVAIGGVLLQGTTLSSTIASGEYALALGAGGWALGDYSSALGAGSLASARNSVALGAFSIADRDNSVSVGSSGNERQITHVAEGTAATDAINKGQLDGLAGSLSAASHYMAVSGSGDGSDDARASGDYNVALGVGSEAIGSYSTALGSRSLASGFGSVALGAGATATSDLGSEANIAIGTNAMALSPGGGGISIGTEATTLNNSIAIGTFSQANGIGSMAFGSNSVAETDGAIAIGSNYFYMDGEDPGIIEGATSVGRNGVAIGATARANGDNGVAIGPRAVTNGNNSVALDALSYADRDNTVSVGSILSGSTRQITNVAAGTEDNDAVNLGQMNSAIGAVSTSFASALTYGDASKKTLTLAGSDGSVIDNLAEGTLVVGSKQAVNGSQLFQTGDSLAQMLGGGAMMGVNGFTGPVFGVQGGSYHNVGDAVGALDGALDSLGNRVSDLESGTPGAASNPKPVARMARDVTPPAAPPAADPGVGADTGKEIVTQDQLDDVKDYADAGNQQTLGSANQYTDRKLADKVSQSDFNEFKGNVDQRFDKVNKKISRVGAMASAMAGMAGSIAAAPANENRISMALGGYGGQTALSLGYAKRVANSGAVLIGGSIASGGESSGTVGVSFGW
jgi:trimeric autotransporter adhesin